MQRAPVNAGCGEDALAAQLIALSSHTPWFMRALNAAQRLRLPSWCIGAGAVRTLVWDALHSLVSPSHLPDVDLVYFDDADDGTERERQLQQALQSYAPEFRWEVVNQAHVHRWLSGAHDTRGTHCKHGTAVAPFRSLEEGVASWPEFATCVGVYVQADGHIGVVAPHGLDDLFAMTLRHNSSRVSAEVFLERMAKKDFQRHWPRVRVIAPTATDTARLTAPLAPPSTSPR